MCAYQHIRASRRGGGPSFILGVSIFICTLLLPFTVHAGLSLAGAMRKNHWQEGRTHHSMEMSGVTTSSQSPMDLKTASDTRLGMRI
jgi:hypothetical protein